MHIQLTRAGLRIQPDAKAPQSTLTPLQSGLAIAVEFPRDLPQSTLGALDEWLKTHRNARLIALRTLPTNRNTLRALNALMAAHNVGLVIQAPRPEAPRPEASRHD